MTDSLESTPDATVRLSEASREQAFLTLADAHLDASYRLAAAILGDRSEAEDATQDALVVAWRRWSQLRDPSRFEAWFHRILVNTCRDRLRQTVRRRSVDLSGELAGPSDPTAELDDHDQIGRALARLSPDHRIVVTLRYSLDLPIDEIARRLGIPAGTVSSRLHNALRQMRTGVDR
ncbi:MAG: RNA polymerase sigma factor [Chloroflexota bacterium]